MHRSILSVIILLFTLNISAQDDGLREIFVEAESHYLFGEYELANPLYLILDDYMTDNASIKFKIGNCYLHIPGEKDRAIPYLEEAVKNSSYDAKPGSFRENRAPLEAYFSLASAYRIQYEFDKALNSYTILNELLPEEGELENAGFIDQQINACHNAMNFVRDPVGFNKQNLGPGVNTGSMNINPVISADGNTLVFTEQRGLENAIFHVKKTRGSWGEPVDITEQLGGETDCTSSSLNADGTELYLYKNDNFVGNIYMSSYDNDSWSEIKKLNRNINTVYFESHASISFDGAKLYFTSNRPGGEGGLDIYVAEKNSNDEWEKPVNMGPVINTPFNEETPFISDNDSILFFSSEGHINMGGYDIFKTRLEGSKWENPSNIGYPLNTPDNDLFLSTLNNGLNAYYSMPSRYKERDIFYLDLDSDNGLLTFGIKGIFSLSDTTIPFNDNYRIIIYNKSTEDTVDIGYPNKSSGFYSFLVKPGEYTITYQGPGYLPFIKELSLPENHTVKQTVINAKLEPDENYIPKMTAKFEKLDFSKLQVIESVDSSILVTDVVTRDVRDSDSTNSDVLYYTVQVLALYNPVDVTFFRDIDVTVMYNDKDRFYRYTTGKFKTKQEAYRRRDELIQTGYPDDLFIKTVFREDQ